MGLVTGPSLDLTTVDEAGNPWGFAKTSMRQKALRLIDQEQPLVVVVSGRAGGGGARSGRKAAGGAQRAAPRQGEQQWKARNTAREKARKKQLELQRQAPCLSKYDCVGSLFIKEIRLASHDSQLLRSP